MTITFSWWAIPLILSTGMFVWMSRPYQRSGDYDFGVVFRLFWLLPIMFVWLIYFVIF